MGSGGRRGPGWGSQETELITRASLVAQVVKNLPAKWETWVRPLGWQDLLEKGEVTHSSILAWEIPWTEEPGMGSQKQLSN